MNSDEQNIHLNFDEQNIHSDEFEMVNKYLILVVLISCRETFDKAKRLYE